MVLDGVTLRNSQGIFLNVQFPGVYPEADFNGDDFVNPDDLSDFITTFFLGC